MRALLLVATAALHGVFLFVFTRSPAQRAEPFSQQIAMLLVPLLEEETSASPEPSVQRTPAPRAPESRPPERAVSEAPTIAVPQPEPTRAPIDWHSQAQSAARSTMDRERELAERRGFSGPKRDPGPLIPEPPPLFPEPRSLAGTVEKTDDGKIRYWLNDSCYQPIEESGDVSITRCFVRLGKRHVRGDLFEHLKPKYLEAPKGSGEEQAPEAESVASQSVLENAGERLEEE